jgi:hypothetical protein
MHYKKMMMKKYIVITSFIITVTGSKLLAQTDFSAAMANADTSRFSANKKDGWLLFDSYVSAWQTDSAQLELLIQHANTINFKQEQLIGKIKYPALKPGKEQSAVFSIVGNTYQLRIDNNGKCYLKFMNGGLPYADPVVLPIRVYYKL